jgi:cytochrome bd-type quinol oxidase subunit 2
MKEAVFLAATKIDPTKVGVPTVNADGNAIQNLLNVVYFWAGLVAVLVIVIAGYYFVTSRGDANQVSRARNAVISASIGLVIVLLAFTITQFILGKVG